MKHKIIFALVCIMVISFFNVPIMNAEKYENGAYIITPTAENCIDFNGWIGASGLKRYDGVTVAPTGGGNAIFEVPESLDGWVDVYYYIPKHTDIISCAATLIVDKVGVKEIVLPIQVSNTQGGFWQKAGTVYFSNDIFETINVSRGDSGASRLTDVKFVPGGLPSYIITLGDFSTTGDWQNLSQQGAYHERALFSNKANGENAIVRTNDLTPGEYYVYVHSLDFAYKTGSRNFSMIINGTEFKKKEDRYFGTHLVGSELENSITDSNLAIPYFDWEKVGSPKDTITVGEDGVLCIELLAKSGNARVDGLFLTTDPNLEMLSTMEQSVKTYEAFPSNLAYQEQILFPENAKGTLKNVESTAVLQNKYTNIMFKKGISSENRTVVQREIKVGDTVVVPFENGLGFLSLYAEKVNSYQRVGYYGSYDVSFTSSNGEMINRKTDNVFLAGIPEWLVPDTLEQIDENTVQMTAVGTNCNLVAIWTLEESDKEPKVEVTFTAKKDGEYSLGLFNEVNEIPKNQIAFVLNPYRWQESRYPDPGVTITETNSSTNHTQMTYKMNEFGQEISLGVAIDQSSIDITVPMEGTELETRRWPHDTITFTGTSSWTEDIQPDGSYKSFLIDYTEENADFVMNTTGANGNIQPAIFAPKMASVDSAFKAGESYTVSYRPLSIVSNQGENRGWYDCYNHVVKDIRGVYDYRDNYYSSMTDASFNILNLLKNDFMSGWSNDMLGHINVEDVYWSSNSNGLVYLQNYLLTEDEELLHKRTLPSMAAMLTRGSHHFYRDFTLRNKSEGPINKELDFTSVGMGNAGFEGAYQMTHGVMPIFRTISKKRLMSTEVESGELFLRNTTDLYWFERANGSESYSETIKNADEYLKNRAFVSASNKVDEESFLNISYTPQFQAQFDAYEITGDIKYLEGAIEGARRFLPTIRVTDMAESKDQMVVENIEQHVNEDKKYRTDALLYDGQRYRRGAEMIFKGETVNENDAVYSDYETVGYAEDAITVRDMTGAYPAWVTARTGLGVEQFYTCLEGKNIMMSTWAGDVLRLGYLSNDQVMMDLARSSIVGRFSNYPGYYYTNYTRLPGQPDYPTESFDITSLYFHHIPVFLAAVQDYLFSNAWVKSEGKVDFPNTRVQGYAWFNNRMYGHEPGTIYNETNMWPWLKEGTISVSSKQIDWIAGRKNGRVAFVLTNAGDNIENITVKLNPELGVQEGSIVTIYDKEGNISTTQVMNGIIQISIPQKGIKTIAMDGTNVKAPQYSEIEFDEKAEVTLDQSAIGLMYANNTYAPSYYANASGGYNYSYSTETGYDVKAYALSMDSQNYAAYIFVGGRSADQYSFIDETGKTIISGGDGDKGIIKTTLKWHFDDEKEINTVVDEVFPYEFLISDVPSDKKVVFTVETEFKNETKALDKEYIVAPKRVTFADEVTKENFAAIPMDVVINNLEGVSEPLTQGTVKFCIHNTEITQTAFNGYNFMADDAIKGCYLSGYLKVKDVDATDNIEESGYLIFDNVEIIQSRNNATKTRVDFSIADPFTGLDNANLDQWAVYDKDGSYLGVKQNVLSIDNQSASYEWGNLYITNAKNDNTVKVSKDGNVYTISCDGAKFVKVFTATYQNGRMTDISFEDVIVSFNNPKTITVLSENQKVFVWENMMYEGSTLKPLLPVLIK